ncbi:MAG: autotransporter outer membrane beta-barrel domain-containing protein [Pseudorhodobacter sp.]
MHYFLKVLFATTALTSVPALSLAQVIIDNGTVQLGINPAGNLVRSGIGLTFLPSSGEALAPGCACEGWGIADLTLPTSFGKAGQTFGFSNIASSSVTASGTGTHGLSVGSAAVSVTNVVAGDFNVNVTHSFAPSATPSLYTVDVDVVNNGGPIGQLVYRRAMDWDVPPTEFSEFVTIQGWPATRLIASSNDGFVDGNPHQPLTTITPTAVLNGNFANDGPSDHGAAFDFSFGAIASGARTDFTIFYGAAASEADAMLALGAVGAEVFSLGKPSSEGGLETGAPNTFIFGFAGVGGTPVLPDGTIPGSGGATAPINQFTQVAEAFTGRAWGEASNRMADNGFGDLMTSAGLLAEPEAGKRRVNFHVSAFGGSGKFNGTANNVAVDYNQRGLSLAVDTAFATGIGGMEKALVGLQIGRSDIKAKLGTGFGTLDAKSTDTVLYGRLSGASNIFAEGLVSYGRHSYTQRRVGLMDTFVSNPRGSSAGALLRVGYAQQLAAAEGTINQLSYYGEVSRNRTKISAATETLNGLATSSFSDRQSMAGVGLRFDTARRSGDLTTFARFDVAALFETGDKGYRATQTTAGGAVLTRVADAVDGNVLRVRATLGMTRRDNLSGSIEYSGTVGRKDFRAHRITARMKLEF